MTLLEANHLTKRFKRGGIFFEAVSDASLSIGAGEMAAIIGRSGSGKTTLLNLLTGVIQPDNGEVLIESISLYGLPETELAALRNQRIGYVPQGRSLLGSLSAIDNVRLPFYLSARLGGSRQRALSIMRDLSIDHLADSQPQILSGGELRRVALARALMNSPALLVADEPTSDLDEKNASELMDLLRSLASSGTAIVVATHDRLAASRADRVLSMAEGVLSRLADPMAGFQASPQMDPSGSAAERPC